MRLRRHAALQSHTTTRSCCLSRAPHSPTPPLPLTLPLPFVSLRQALRNADAPSSASAPSGSKLPSTSVSSGRLGERFYAWGGGKAWLSVSEVVAGLCECGLGKLLAKHDAENAVRKHLLANPPASSGGGAKPHGGLLSLKAVGSRLPGFDLAARLEAECLGALLGLELPLDKAFEAWAHTTTKGGGVGGPSQTAFVSPEGLRDALVSLGLSFEFSAANRQGRRAQKQKR